MYDDMDIIKKQNKNINLEPSIKRMHTQHKSVLGPYQHRENDQWMTKLNKSTQILYANFVYD